MQTINFDTKDLTNAPAVAERATEILKSGGIIAYPTDTVYGLGANALDAAAIEKIYQIKQRSSQKPLSVAVKDLAMAERIAVISAYAKKFLSRVWPGPITVILPQRSLLPENLTGGNPVGIRCIPHPFLEALFSKIDLPITATSANISGEGSVSNIAELKKQFQSALLKPDLVIDAGTLPPSPASTVIDLCGIEPKILRTGAMSPKKLLQIFDELR